MTPHDHPNFAPETRLIRRISREQIVPDRNRNCDRLSSAVYAFDNPADHLSCDSATCISLLNRDPGDYVKTPGWEGAVWMTVEAFRSVERPEAPFKIGMVPLADNPCHGGVWGKITRGQANRLLKNSEWLNEIVGVEVCPKDV